MQQHRGVPFTRFSHYLFVSARILVVQVKEMSLGIECRMSRAGESVFCGRGSFAFRSDTYAAA